jgi:3-oxoacyl-[acyl-carrier-protein] synthase-3
MTYKKINIGIKGSGSYTPEKILTNFDLEKMVDTSDEWITSRTGIKERRIADENTATSDLATKAALKAIEEAKVNSSEIDMIIVATVTPDMFFPSTACFVQKNINAINATAFDISAACSGFIYGLSIASQFISSGEVKTVLLIGAETMSKVVDWQDRNTCILLGDGAGAVILGEVEDGKGILSVYTLSDGSKTNLLMVPSGGSREPISIEVIKKRSHYMKMEGNEVFKFAIRGMEKSIDEALKKANLTYEDVTLFIPHQANIRIIDSLTKRMGLPKDRVFTNLDKYGNTSAASIPIALDEAIKSGRVKSGDIILMSSFGSGFTMGAAVIRW